MEELKGVIAQNIADLRTRKKWTQAELAARLNYSDKAVSKWERGESIPDVIVLKQIADLFSVTVDYLLTAEHEAAPLLPKTDRRHRVITALSAALVWLLATAAFALSAFLAQDLSRTWLLFVFALPVTCIVLLVFNSLWGRRRRNYLIISLLVWTLLLSLYLSLPIPSGWMLFLLGIPAQIIILLWSRLAR